MECHVEVFSILGTRLKVRDSVVLSELARHLLVDLDVVDEVHFVTKHYYLRVRVSIFPNLGEPVAHILEAMSVGDIVDENDPCNLLVVSVSEWSELHLACGVPDCDLNA